MKIIAERGFFYGLGGNYINRSYYGVVVAVDKLPKSISFLQRGRQVGNIFKIFCYKSFIKVFQKQM